MEPTIKKIDLKFTKRQSNLKKIESIKTKYYENHYNEHVKVLVKGFNSNKHRVLVSINGKVFNTNYGDLTIKNNLLMGKLSKIKSIETEKFNYDFYTNSLPFEFPLLSFNEANSKDIEIKAFVFDFVNDTIVEAKKQTYIYASFEGNNLVKELRKAENLVTISKNIIGAWDRKKLIEQALKENPLPEPPKTKIHFTVGMFFDGTGNNRFNSDKKYYPNLKKGNVFPEINSKDIVKLKKGKERVYLENDSSYFNSYSNIPLLHDLYKTESYDKTNNTIVLKQYVQGIGTLKDEVDDTWGLGFGEGERGIIGKIREGCRDLVIRQIKPNLDSNSEIGSLTFDVFGFSRGAASARHFCNEILGINQIKYNMENPDLHSKNQGSTGVKKIPVSKEYLLGILGEELKREKISYSFIDNNDNSKDSNIAIRFLGLFDTVASQFIPKYYEDYHLNKIKEYNETTKLIGSSSKKANLEIHNLPIEKVVHLVAKDEWRENFPSTSTKTGITIPMIGAHSDIGGSYAASLVEKNTLHHFTIHTGTNEQAINYPTIDGKNEAIKDFFVKNGYCNSSEIEFEEIGNTYIEINNFTNAEDGVIFKVKSERKIKPRYSIVPLRVMQHLALISNVPFLKSHTEIKPDKENKLYNFEYEMPKELEPYCKTMFKIAEEQYDKIYKNKRIAKETKIDEKTKLKIKHDFIHLSSHLNNPKFTLPKIVTKSSEVKFDPNELDFVKQLVYVNHPRVINSIDKPYEREIF